MNIFADIHTYLIISFLAMCILLYKYTHKKLANGLNAEIAKIKNEIEHLEKKKKLLQEAVTSLKLNLSNAQINIKESITKAEREAKDINEKSSKDIAEVIARKQQEYDESIKKIKEGLSTELKNKIIHLAVKEAAEKFKGLNEDRDLQNKNIENSFALIEAWINERDLQFYDEGE